MSAAEVGCLVLGVALAAVIGARLALWARRQVRLAEALTRRGWLIVGCPFWTGPEVIPPPGKSSSEIRADMAAALREVGNP
jgi:hypothetical protein